MCQTTLGHWFAFILPTFPHWRTHARTHPHILPHRTLQPTLCATRTFYPTTFPYCLNTWLAGRWLLPRILMPFGYALPTFMPGQHSRARTLRRIGWLTADRAALPTLLFYWDCYTQFWMTRRTRRWFAPCTLLPTVLFLLLPLFLFLTPVYTHTRIPCRCSRFMTLFCWRFIVYRLVVRDVAYSILLRCSLPGYVYLRLLCAVLTLVGWTNLPPSPLPS